MQNVLLVLISFLVSIVESVHFFVTAKHKLCAGVPSFCSAVEMYWFSILELDL